MKEASTQSSSGQREKIAMPHRGGNRAFIIIALVVVAIVVIAAAFATGMLSLGSDKGTVTLTGAGATFPMPLILKWADEYYNETDGKVKVNYGGGGSGAGITQIKDQTVVFAGTDAPLSGDESSQYGLVHIPETLGAVVVAFNVPGLATLKLDGDTLAKIFMKNITKWNDPAIVALNAGASLPDNDIQTVVRSDSSGTTFVFTGYLEIVSSEFASIYGQAKSLTWPGAIGASGNPGVTSTVKSTSYSIGYIELSYAMQNEIPFAQLKNKDGNFVVASLDTTSAAAAAAGASLPAGGGDWSNVNILNAPGSDSYPIASFTYILVYKELYDDATKLNKTAAEALVDFLWWMVHDEAQSWADDLYYAPLPASVVALNEATLEALTYQGEPVL
ncbi:MAG: phosphate ABC transporter substrate-binding protein PstS [Candidatus Thermoplasmatota archaeon]|nr:phosphate ABC transporter substrate-binding protein PstS [Candidatus Thermoplasmatota archaeon]